MATKMVSETFPAPTFGDLIFLCHHLECSLISRSASFPPPVFDLLQYANKEWEGLGDLDRHMRGSSWL